MFATVLPFPPLRAPVGPSRITARELDQAAERYALRGPDWWVETLRQDDGGVSLGLVTPSSEEDPPGGDPMLAWHVEREAAGLALVDTTTGNPTGLFTTLGALLWAVATIEAARAGERVANEA